jgi:hypothetical protein
VGAAVHVIVRVLPLNVELRLVAAPGLVQELLGGGGGGVDGEDGGGVGAVGAGPESSPLEQAAASNANSMTDRSPTRITDILPASAGATVVP